MKEENSPLSIYNLRINYLKEPFGIDIQSNVFSFLSNEKGPFKASIILDNEIVQTKEISINECHSFTFNEPLKYHKNYKYIVEISSSKSELIFETAYKLEHFFIKPKNKDLFSPIFIKNFNLNKNVKKARLYISGLGLYQGFINGKKIGKAFLTPGFNDYDYYLRYQTYDITKLLENDNIIEIYMGNGWYKGRIGLNKENENIYGDEYKLCLNIFIEYIDNEIINIKADETWKVKSSKQLANSIYDALPEKSLEDVIICEEKYNLIPDYGALIVEKDILHSELYISPKGEQILDFKQNMVGFARFKGFLGKGQEIKLSHGEILQEKCFYNKNYRSDKLY